MNAEPKPTIRFKRQTIKRRLGKRIVEALTPPPEANGKPTRGWVYDTQTARLAVCVWSSGARVWYWVGRFDGRMLRMKLGTYPETTPEQARKLAGQASADVSAGRDPRADRRQART
ncbi:MAG: Arm DNA-binding domain-containing protein, partial [Planctomycetota bacterium]